MRGESPWPLVLVGSVGVGKTCAMLALADHADGQAWYVTEPALCQAAIEAGKGGFVWTNAEGEQSALTAGQLWGLVGRCRLVALDELGGRREVSDHRYETVRRVIDDRFGKPLAVASNLDLDALAGLYDDRVSDRLAAGTVVRVGGKSRRGVRPVSSATNPQK